ncbi:MAG: hypothetical protein GY765_11125, partial [bacterium]|nr:hypothetical protein [bacterium]
YKRRIDNFLNNLLILLKEDRKVFTAEDTNTENTDTGDAEPPMDKFKVFRQVREYKGSSLANQNLFSQKVRNFQLQGFPPSPGEEGEYFEKLLKQFAMDKVKVVFVVLPDYIGSFHTNHQRERFMIHLKRFRKKLGNISIYNYNRRKRFPLRETDYFLDGGWGHSNSHLSDIGAREFNRLLVKDLAKHYGPSETKEETIKPDTKKSNPKKLEKNK